MDNGKKHAFGLQFKVLATLAALFTAFVVVAALWGLSFVQDKSLADAESRAVALSDQMDAVWDYVDENQPATNVYVQELGDLARGLVCVTAVKSIARDFNRENTGEIHIVALKPRNKEDSPDAFERQALEAFAADETLDAYSGVAVDESGAETYYYLRPRRIIASCLTCHGDPAGERDPLGYDKEGYTVGMVAGAVSVREPLSGYASGAQQVAYQGILLFLCGLLAVMAVMYAILRRFVIQPVAQVSAAASAYRPGEGSPRLEQTDGSDEIAELARDFNAMADDLDGLYSNLELRVEERTEELARLNAELASKQKELVQAFAKLQDETQYKSRLFASLSHDLRTPLASIIAYTQLAETANDAAQADGQAGQMAASARDRETIARIGEQARTLVGMVDNILAFARADAQGIELHPTTVDLVDLATHLRSTMEPIAARKDLAFQVQADADLPLIQADRNLLVRVMENLATNACKFTPAGGSVLVRIASEPQTSSQLALVTISVEDTGIGIAPEDRSRIFEPYTKGAYREGGSRTGAGLGLAVIRQIADAMHGEVSADSRPEGGSRFTFSFPATVLDEEEYE